MVEWWGGSRITEWQIPWGGGLESLAFNATILYMCMDWCNILCPCRWGVGVVGGVMEWSLERRGHLIHMRGGWGGAHQVFGLCIEGSRGACQVNGDDTHIQGRRVPKRNVSTVLPKGLIGDMIHGMFLKIRVVHNSFIGIFFYQGVSLTTMLVNCLSVLDYFINFDITLLLYIDPGL